MNETSTTASETRSPSSAGSRARALTRSWTTTRASEATDVASWPRPTSTAWTRDAPRWSNTSVNPPVEAPASRQTRPAGSTPNASSAPASFSPPRDTYGSGAISSTAREPSTRSPGFRSTRAASPDPTRTRPPSSSAWARLRDPATPRSTSSSSRRTRGARRGRVEPVGSEPRRRVVDTSSGAHPAIMPRVTALRRTRPRHGPQASDGVEAVSPGAPAGRARRSASVSRTCPRIPAVSRRVSARRSPTDPWSTNRSPGIPTIRRATSR